MTRVKAVVTHVRDWTAVKVGAINNAMRERGRNMVVRVADDELARAHALANAGDEPIATMIRRWIRERYVARFGDAAPPAPKLKHAPKSA